MDKYIYFNINTVSTVFTLMFNCYVYRICSDINISTPKNTESLTQKTNTFSSIQDKKGKSWMPTKLRHLFNGETWCLYISKLNKQNILRGATCTVTLQTILECLLIQVPTILTLLLVAKCRCFGGTGILDASDESGRMTGQMTLELIRGKNTIFDKFRNEKRVLQPLKLGETNCHSLRTWTNCWCKS